MADMLLSERSVKPERLTCSEVQRRGFPARRVSAVHVLGRHQFPDPLQVSAPTGLEQLPAALTGTRLCHLHHHGSRRHGSAPETQDS